MRWIRIAYFTLAGWLPVVAGIGFFTVYIVSLRIFIRDRDRFEKKAQDFKYRFWKWYFARLPFLSIRVYGAEKLPSNTAFVLVTNHSSFLDVPLLFSIVPELSGIAREYLFRVPGLGMVLRTLGFFPIRRQSDDDGLGGLVACRDILNSGRNVLIMPEGERVTPGKVGRFSPGAFHLARMGNVPVVPAVLINLEKALPPGRMIPQVDRAVDVEVRFFDPILPPVDDDRESVREMAQKTRRMLCDAIEKSRSGEIANKC